MALRICDKYQLPISWPKPCAAAWLQYRVPPYELRHEKTSLQYLRTSKICIPACSDQAMSLNTVLFRVVLDVLADFTLMNSRAYAEI